MDVKAEHFERQVQRLEQERDVWEKKYEVCRPRHVPVCIFDYALMLTGIRSQIPPVASRIGRFGEVDARYLIAVQETYPGISILHPSLSLYSLRFDQFYKYNRFKT